MEYKSKNSKFYDKQYGLSKYKNNYKDLPWYPVWKQVVEWIPKDGNVLDLGCGAGFFASVLFNRGIKKYTGIDFSPVGITKAKEKINSSNFEFILGDIYNVTNFNNYDVIVLTEVLEHIKNDKKVLLKIPKGKLVLFSVPTFLGKSHVRKFDSCTDVCGRYKDILDIRQIVPMKGYIGKKKEYKLKWFVCKSYKR